MNTAVDNKVQFPRGMFHGWWLLGVAFLCQFVNLGVLTYSFGLILAPMANEFGSTQLQVTLNVSAMILVAGIMSPYLGVIIDKKSLKLMFALGSVSICLSLVLLSFATAMWQVTLNYASLAALSYVLLGPLTSSTMLARWFSRRRGFVLGLAALGTSFGGLVIPPMLQWLIQMFEWRDALRCLGVICFVLTMPAIVFAVKNSPADIGLQPDGDPQKDEDAQHLSSQQAPANPYNNTKAILGTRNFWLIAFAMSSIASVFSALLSNIVTYAASAGYPSSDAVVLISVIGLFGMIGKIGFGFLADRIDLRIAIGASAVMVLLGLVCFLLASSYLLLLTASVSLGLATGGILPVIGAIIASIFGPQNFARILGMMMTVLVPFLLISTPLMGWIYDTTGSYSLSFVIFIIEIVAALLLVPFIKIPEKNQVIAEGAYR
jgi:MFS family permease